jgi:archaemetzincin
MSSKKKLIGVLALGQVPENALDIISFRIKEHLHITPHLFPALDSPEYAFNEKRFQYDAGIIIDTLESMRFNNVEKVIGVTSRDIFIPIFTHVYGEARQGGKCALVSLFRLRENPDGSVPSAKIINERVAKVALHELGHLYNLLHCGNKKCLMHFSGCVKELDEGSIDLCEYCAIYIKDKLRR